MSALDFRRIERIECGGISIATFLSDDRNTIMVSATDLVEQLSLYTGPLEEMGDVYHFVAYDALGKQHEHHCITHDNLNEFLWVHDCSDRMEDDLDTFRKFFLYEVMTFWTRFAPAPGSLSVRDAANLIDHRNKDYFDDLEIPKGRATQICLDALGYTEPKIRSNMTSEEVSFMAFAELLYASVAASEQANGVTVPESMRLAETRLQRPLKEIGYHVRNSILNIS